VPSGRIEVSAKGCKKAPPSVAPTHRCYWQRPLTSVSALNLGQITSAQFFSFAQAPTIDSRDDSESVCLTVRSSRTYLKISIDSAPFRHIMGHRKYRSGAW
jgi:hypothetical protein